MRREGFAIDDKPKARFYAGLMRFLGPFPESINYFAALTELTSDCGIQEGIFLRPLPE
jgi:hypothetical protein